MIALLDPQRHQGSGKIEARFIELPETGRLKPAGCALP